MVATILFLAIRPTLTRLILRPCPLNITMSQRTLWVRAQTGLALTRRILSCAETWLRDTGLLVVEVGNSWTALEEAYPEVPFTWLEFEHGGEGVFAISAPELQEYRTKWRQLGL